MVYSSNNDGGDAWADFSDLEELIINRLEDAGRVLLALPSTGYSTRLHISKLDVVRDFQAYGWDGERPHVPVPSSVRISRMEEALQWIQLLSDEQVHLRRILDIRMLVHPLNDRHIYSWRKTAEKLGVSSQIAKIWHSRAIGVIRSELMLREIRK